MNTYDWLVNLPINDADLACRVIEVSFNQGSRKDFYRNNSLQQYEKGEMISVEGVSGFDLGEVSLTGEVVRIQLKKKGVDEFNPEMKRVLRRSTDRDIDLWKQNKARERDALIRSRAIARTKIVSLSAMASRGPSISRCSRSGAIPVRAWRTWKGFWRS